MSKSTRIPLSQNFPTEQSGMSTWSNLWQSRDLVGRLVNGSWSVTIACMVWLLAHFTIVPFWMVWFLGVWKDVRNIWSLTPESTAARWDQAVVEMRWTWLFLWIFWQNVVEGAKCTRFGFWCWLFDGSTNGF